MAGVTSARPPRRSDSALAAWLDNRQALRRAHHVRLLLGVRWRLTWRAYTRGWRQVAGLAVLLLFLLVVCGSLALLTGVAYSRLDRAGAGRVLFVVLTGLYALWAVLPLLQYTVNEGLDITRLQTYPLTRTEQISALLFSSLFDVSTLALFCMYLPVLVGWHASPLASVITLAALALIYLHTVTFSQLVLTCLMGLLRNRRYRDVALLAAVTGSFACVLLFQLGLRALQTADPAALLSFPLERYVQALPPGMAARAITLASAGQIGPALLWLLALAALLPVLLAIWSRLLAAEMHSAGARALRWQTGGLRQSASAILHRCWPPARPAARAAALGALLHRWPLPAPVRAIALKDARYLWRDPQLKAALLSALFPLALIFFPHVSSGDIATLPAVSPHGPSTGQVLLAPLPGVFVTLTLSLNILGLERQSLQMLFLFPVRPLQVLLGKNLTVGSLAFLLETLVTVAACALSGDWLYLPLALVPGLAAILVALGCGNVTSVLVPFRVRAMQTGSGSGAAEGGCLRSLLLVGVFGVTLAVLLPVVAAITLPLVFGAGALLAVTLPAALLYGVLWYALATRLIAPHLLTRAPEILALTTRDV